MAHRPKQNTTKANDAKDRMVVDTLAEERDHKQATLKLNDCYVQPADDENLERDEPDLGEEDKDDDEPRHKPPHMAGFPQPISPWLHSSLWSLASTWTPELLSRWLDPRKRWAPELQKREFSLRDTLPMKLCHFRGYRPRPNVEPESPERVPSHEHSKVNSPYLSPSGSRSPIPPPTGADLMRPKRQPSGRGRGAFPSAVEQGNLRRSTRIHNPPGA
ncbi:hypothetical protein XPA_000964 [Xanthoria parietina]